MRTRGRPSALRLRRMPPCSLGCNPGNTEWRRTTTTVTGFRTAPSPGPSGHLPVRRLRRSSAPFPPGRTEASGRGSACSMPPRPESARARLPLNAPLPGCPMMPRHGCGCTSMSRTARMRGRAPTTPCATRRRSPRQMLCWRPCSKSSRRGGRGSWWLRTTARCCSKRPAAASTSAPSPTMSSACRSFAGRPEWLRRAHRTGRARHRPEPPGWHVLGACAACGPFRHGGRERDLRVGVFTGVFAARCARSGSGRH